VFVTVLAVLESRCRVFLCLLMLPVGVVMGRMKVVMRRGMVTRRGLVMVLGRRM
jgi:hypothetical protein